MQEYRVTVGEYTTGTIRFYKPGTNELHRLDGPAIEFTEGAVEYWIEGNKLTPAQFKEKTAPVKEMTVAEIEAKLGHKVKIVK